MKKFAAMAMLLSAGLFGLGCDTTQQDVKKADHDVQHAQREGQHDVEKAKLDAQKDVIEAQKDAEETRIEAQKDQLKDNNAPGAADTTPAPANP